jgi:hypothetical protein
MDIIFIAKILTLKNHIFNIYQMTPRLIKLIFIASSIFIIANPSYAIENKNDNPLKIIVSEATLKQETPTIKSEADKIFNLQLKDAQTLYNIIEKGDRLSLTIEDNNLNIKKINTIEKQTSKFSRVLALGFGFVSLLLLALWASKGNPFKYIIGFDNRYSNSKTQVALWFSTLWAVYLATLALRVNVLGWDFLGGIGISENLLALSGLSALTYGAAKAVTSQQVANDASSKKVARSPKFPDDLFQNDDKDLDLGDSQMFFVTLLAVVIFLLTAFNYLEWIEYAKTVALPDVDTTLLSAFGLGQGAYLIKKVSQ